MLVIRATALVFAGIIVVFVLTPAHLLFPGAGAACIVGGLVLYGFHPLAGVLVLGLGLLLVAVGVKINVDRQRQVAEESAKTLADIRRRFRPDPRDFPT